ncbi:MAG TPA: hypothetical protein DF966_18270 [Sulfitobacter sp.]|nr:hypothetical protein [Sulfitobacter sp.]|tara:strand:- start:147 stop:329 length:183 start_codon:yes stop_codon:yes gene_type:complete
MTEAEKIAGNTMTAEEERAAIVAFLESEALERGKKTQDGWALHWAAYAVSRGEHLQEKEQ